MKYSNVNMNEQNGVNVCTLLPIGNMKDTFLVEKKLLWNQDLLPGGVSDASSVTYSR